jgi:hypothetical protein
MVIAVPLFIQHLLVTFSQAACVQVTVLQQRFIQDIKFVIFVDTLISLNGESQLE